MSREMKNSGVEWIGEIPKNWEVKQLRTYFSRRINKNIHLQEKNLLSLSYGHIVRKNIDTKEGLLPESFDGYNIVEDGDIVIRGTDLQNDHRSLRTGLVTERGIITSAYMTIRPKENVNSTYYHYLLHCYDISKVFYSMGGGLRQSLDYWEFIRMPVLHPTDREQEEIVSYIKTKCTAIDTAIEKTKKSIEKLEEYKKAVITKAVTKGIDPSAKMKDAHFLWLTAIPENWGIYKLNHILDYNHPYPLGDGDHGSIKADSYVSSGIPFIRVQNLGYADPINIENIVYITEAQNQKIQNSTLFPNDILFAKTGATIGKTAIMPQTISRANTTSHVGKITVDTRYYVPKYIFYALSSEIGNHQLWSIANKKATRPEVGLDEVKYIKLCIPFSVNGQKQIANFLDEKLNQITDAISKHVNLIRKLEEYKKSLIYYAVTGKIDCRNEVIE